MRSFIVIAAALVIAGLPSAALAQAAPVGPAPSPGCSLAPVPGIEQRLSSGGRERTYRLFVPSGAAGRSRLPLVLDLHPSGGTAAGQAKTSGLEAVAEREGFTVSGASA